MSDGGARRPSPPLPDWPRLMDRRLAAAYFSVSEDSFDRLVQTGQLTPVSLPFRRHQKTGRGTTGLCRRTLFDRLQLDEAAERFRRG